MIELPIKIASVLCEVEGIGYYSEFGAVVGDSEFIVYFEEDNETPFLAHISEFEQDGILIRPKKSE